MVRATLSLFEWRAGDPQRLARFFRDAGRCAPFFDPVGNSFGLWTARPVRDDAQKASVTMARGPSNV